MSTNTSKSSSVIPFKIPANRLAPEILAGIFGEVLGDELVDLQRDSIPNTLRSVSSRWNSAALISHCLWSRLDLDISDERASRNFPIAALDRWLSRAGILPLTLRIRFRKPPLNLPLLIEALVPYLLKCERLTLDAPFDHVADFLVATAETGRVPFSLRVLEIVAQDYADLVAEGADIEFADCLPFSIWYPFPATPPSPTSIPAGLTELTVRGALVEPSLFNSLKHLTRLQSLSLLDFESHSDVVGIGLETPVSLPHLNYLHICSEYGIGSILDIFILPSLATLKFHLEGANELVPFLPAFLERCHPPLEELEVNFQTLTAPVFMTCLRRLPTLKTIFVGSPTVIPELLENLTPPLLPHPADVPNPDLPGPFLPNISSITFARWNDLDDIPQFEDMIRHRYDMGLGTLQRIRFVGLIHDCEMHAVNELKRSHELREVLKRWVHY